MNTLQLSKARSTVQHFFGESLADPEIDLAELIESVAFTLGSTLALRVKEEGQSEVMEATFKRMKAGCDIGNKIKPAFPFPNGPAASGIHIIIIEGP